MNKQITQPLLATTTALLSLSSCSTKSQDVNNQSNQPNVIFIYADDIGYGDLCCYGYGKVPTPNVEKLAQAGILFTNAHATAATSTPSRYAMLTGEYAWRKEGTGVAAGNAGMIIRPDRFTIADMFKESGYKTGVVGKWHLGLGDKTAEQDWNSKLDMGPSDIGFEYSYIMAATGDRVPCVWVENEKVVNLDPNDPIYVSYKENFVGEPTGKENPELLYKQKPSHGHDMSIVNGISRIGYMKGGKSALWTDENIADSITTKALNFIETNKENPFFLYLATNDIHVPRVPHPRFAGKSGLGPRGDALLEFDWTVGEVMKKLKELGIDKNTIILLSSDNGPVVDDGYQDNAVELLGEHKPSGAFRGGKYSAFEAGTRVPFIVCWPETVTPKTTDALTSQIDWFASLATLLDFELPENAAPDSRNEIETILGINDKNRDFVVEQASNLTLSVIKGDWKYIEPNNGPAIIPWGVNIESGNLKTPQLYNIKNDKGENINIADQHPDKIKEFQDMLILIRNSEL